MHLSRFSFLKPKTRIFLSLCLLAVLFVGFRLALFVGGNFHEVVPGELYRSGRPSAEALQRYQDQYHIRSVLNLRGSNPDKGWYRKEVALTKKLGITLIDFPMNSHHALSDDQMQQLIVLMREAPKPLLIHCQAGADRTSLASALYLRAIKGTSAEEAAGQLSLLYGHLPFTFARAYPMDRSFLAFQQAHAIR